VTKNLVDMGSVACLPALPAYPQHFACATRYLRAKKGGHYLAWLNGMPPCLFCLPQIHLTLLQAWRGMRARLALLAASSLPATPALYAYTALGAKLFHYLPFLPLFCPAAGTENLVQALLTC